MWHYQVVAPGTDSKDRVAVVILVTLVMLVSVVMLHGFSYNVTVMPLRYCCVTNFLSNTVNYYTDILNVVNATY